MIENNVKHLEAYSIPSDEIKQVYEDIDVT